MLAACNARGSREAGDSTKYRDFFGEENRAVGEIAESSFVLRQCLISGLPFRGLGRCQNVFELVKPKFRDSIVRSLSAPGLTGNLV